MVLASEIAGLLKRIEDTHGVYDRDRLERALLVAQQCYGDTLHWTGETLLQHTLHVIEQLAPFEPDEDAIVACVLHHVLETKRLSLMELEDEFGAKVRGLVSNIHLLSHVTLAGRRHSIEDLRLMLLSVSDDIRVLFIVLCDRAHCLQFLDAVDSQRARGMCQDVLQLFAPVASRLGIYSLKQELETLAFPRVYPDDAARIEEQLGQVHQQYPNFMERCTTLLDTFLQEQGISGATVSAREKQSYSLFQKMRSKSLTHVEAVHDLFALRVVVKSEEDCYRVLGLLHRLGRPLTNRFKDYIAFPKPNGYQSLHTTLAGFGELHDGAYIEVQIRTEEMHRESQYGVAAHWSYKEHGATARALEKVQLHSMLIEQHPVEHEEPSFADHIFVLTPNGDIIELPEGATPLDFAFQVHTNLGLMFRSARVNGSIVSLDYQLENGDIVEILKYSQPKPSPQWLHVVKMTSSKSKLRRFFYAENRPEHISRGRELVNAELAKRGLPKLTTDLSLLRTCDGETLSLHEREDVLFKIGQGSERAAALMNRLSLPSVETTSQSPGVASGKSTSPTVVGLEDGLRMPIRFAQCCKPEQWPREDIIGNANRHGEIMIHRKSCRMCRNSNPDRRVQVWWQT